MIALVRLPPDDRLGDGREDDRLGDGRKTLLGASLGSAAMQGIFSYIAWHHKRTAHATYLAMRLAVLLDGFGRACRDMIARNANAEPPPDQEFPNWEGLPELPPYPEDSEGWVSLRAALAMRCLRLRGSIRASKDQLNVTSEYAIDDYGDTLDEQAAVLGLQAGRLSEDLHRTYVLGDSQFDYRDTLEATLKRARESISDSARANAESFKNAIRELKAREEEQGPPD